MDKHVPEYMADVVRSTKENKAGYIARAQRLLGLDTHSPPVHWHNCVTAAWEFQALFMEDKKFTSQVLEAAKRFDASLLAALTVEGMDFTPPEDPEDVDPMVLGVCEVLEKLSDAWKRSNPSWGVRSEELKRRIARPDLFHTEEASIKPPEEEPQGFLGDSDSPIYVLEALSEDYEEHNPDCLDRKTELDRLLSDPGCLKEPKNNQPRPK